MKIPIIADTTKLLSARYGVLLENAGIALRGLFIINPEGNMIIIYNFFFSAFSLFILFYE